MLSKRTSQQTSESISRLISNLQYIASQASDISVMEKNARNSISLYVENLIREFRKIEGMEEKERIYSLTSKQCDLFSQIINKTKKALENIKFPFNPTYLIMDEVANRKILISPPNKEEKLASIEDQTPKPKMIKEELEDQKFELKMILSKREKLTLHAQGQNQSISHYDILNITPEATNAEIKNSERAILEQIEQKKKNRKNICHNPPRKKANIFFTSSQEKKYDLKLYEHNVLKAVKCLLDPSERFSYDRFDLGLAESKGHQACLSSFFTNGVISWKSTRKADDKLYSLPLPYGVIGRGEMKDFLFSRHFNAGPDTSLKSAQETDPMIAISFDTIMQSISSESIKSLSTHPLYPVPESKLLPISERSFSPFRARKDRYGYETNSSDNYYDFYKHPSVVIKDPLAIITFIQQFQFNEGIYHLRANAWPKLAIPDGFKQQLWSIQNEIYCNVPNLQFPLPYVMVSKEYSQKLLLSSEEKTKECHRALAEKKEPFISKCSQVLFSKKSTKESNCESLIALKREIQELRKTKQYFFINKSLASVINKIKSQNKKLEENKAIKNLFSELISLEEKTFGDLVKAIPSNTVKKYITEQCIAVGIATDLTSIICDYIHETNKFQDIADKFQHHARTIEERELYGEVLHKNLFRF
jgi:hypothetical protein